MVQPDRPARLGSAPIGNYRAPTFVVCLHEFP